MTERASDLLSELSDRLAANVSQSGMVAAESVRAIEPDILKTYKEGTVDELVDASIKFLEVLFRSLRPDSKVPWHEYYTAAREFSQRYAEKGVPLESLMEGLAVFRRSVIARVTEELGPSEYADEVLLLAQSRLGDVIEHLNTNFVRGYLDYTELRQRARPLAGRDRDRGGRSEGNAQGAGPAGGGRMGPRRGAAQARQDDRHAAGRGGGGLGVRTRRPGQGRRGVVRPGGVTRGPDRRRVERDPGRAAHERRAAGR